MADTDSIENIGNMLDNARTKFMRNLERANMLTKMEDLPQEKAEKLFDEARNLYQKNIRDIQKFAPETFQMWQDSQEKRYVDTLNKLAFESNPDLPYDEELGDELQYLLTMPYGSEAEKGLDLSELTSGVATPKFENQKEVMVSMGADDPETVARHEGFHELTGGEPFSVTDDSGKVKQYGTEYVARSFDYLRALVEDDQELKDRTESYVKAASDNQHGPYTLLKIAIESIPQMYERGVFDKDKVALETAQEVIKKIDEDEQGFIASLLGEEPEKVKEPTVDIEDPLYLVGKLRKGDEDAKEELKKILSVLPFSKKQTKDVPYKDTYSVDRETIGMDEGGLMSDPLTLSETAEEEAEPKMGIGDYLQAGKELVEDFSPAGTAQSMIDAAEEAYKLATGAEDASFLDLGIAAMGALPGGKTAGKVVDNATKIADEIAEASLEISKLDNYVPKKTVKAYKLFTKGEDDNLYPLFVDANNPLPVGEWIKANMPDYIFQAKNGRYYVPSKATAPKTETGKKAFYDTGERKATGSSVEIPDDPELRKKLVEGGFIAKEDTRSVKAVAARPGWHAGDVPIAHHIGAMIDPATGGTKKLEMPNVRRDDQVWAEVELPADVDWQQEALRRANVKKNGEIDVGTAHITDMVPHGGSYRYKTNPNMTGEWLIGGELKINRVLDDAEVKAINDAAGVQDLPRYSEFMDQYVKAPTETGIMSAEGAVKKSPTVDMAINVRVDKKADLDYAEKLISGEKVYETRNSRSLDPYIGQRVGIAKTGDGKAQAIGSVEIGEPIEVDEKTFRELQDKHLVPEGSAFDVPKGGKKYLYPVSNPERFESPKDVGRGIVSRKIVNKYSGGLMLDEYNRAES